MSNPAAHPPRLTRLVRWAYGFGAAAGGINNKVLGAFVLIFYNQVIGLPAATVTMVVTIALIIDAVAAPLVGFASDNLRSRWGRRHPFMIVGLVLYPVAFVLLWNPPQGLTMAELALWLAVSLVSVRVFDTFYDLPSAALLPELARGYDERTKLSALRFSIGIAAAALASILAYNVFMPEGPGGSGGIDARPGWAPYSLVCAVVAFLSIAAAIFATAGRIPWLSVPASRTLNPLVAIRDIAATLGSRSFVVTTGFGGLAAMASGLYFALNVYFLLYFWNLGQGRMALLALPTLVAAALSLIVAPMLGRWLGKKRGAMLLAALACLVCNGPILARVVFDIMPANGSQALFAILWIQAAMFPLCTAGYNILLTSMVADMVEEAQRRTGRRSEGLLHAAESLFKKVISGGGTLAAGWILMRIDFPADAGKVGVAAETLRAMGLFYVPLSVSFSVLAIVALSFFSLDRRAHEDNLRWLETDDIATD